MRLLEKAISYVTPYSCLSCGDEGKILCEFCQTNQLQAPASRCAGCLTLTTDYKTCPKCQPSLRAGHIWVAADYQGVARELVRKFKFAGAREAAHVIARSIADATPYFEREWLVVPMPTTTNHVRKRGFDHTRRLAGRVAQYKNMSFEPLLGRIGQIKQVGAAKTTRSKQVAGTMYVRTSLPPNAKILLIDDVMTTGASLAEATRALKAAGASKVYAAVFAQKVL